MSLLSASFLLPGSRQGKGTVFPSKEMRVGLLCKDPTKVPPAGLAHSLKVSKLLQHLHTHDCREGPMDYAGESVAHKSQEWKKHFSVGPQRRKASLGWSLTALSRGLGAHPPWDQSHQHNTAKH